MSPSIKNSPIFTFDFHPPGTGGYPWGPQGASDEKVASTKSDRRWILEGVPFIKNIEIPKFWSAPQPAPPSGPIFSGRGPKIKIGLPKFCLPCCPDSKKV